jgi:lysophospholipase L1-like esterase
MTPSPKTIALLLSIAALGSPGLRAQAVGPAPAPGPAPKEAKPPEVEWADLSKYRSADDRLGAPAQGERRVVFMGDSITEGWACKDFAFFEGRPYFDRGISGQTSSQMLVRFRQDVINLRPAAVLILAGTNDIAQNGGPTTLEAIEQNLQSMVELARVNGIRVALASVLPAIDYPWRKGLEPAGKIAQLNRWIADFCSRNKVVYIDYYTPMADARGALKADLSEDGVHPNRAGYFLMEPLADGAVRELLAP